MKGRSRKTHQWDTTLLGTSAVVVAIVVPLPALLREMTTQDMWIVVPKIRVSFWYPEILGAVIQSITKRDPHFENSSMYLGENAVLVRSHGLIEAILELAAEDRFE